MANPISLSEVKTEAHFRFIAVITVIIPAGFVVTDNFYMWLVLAYFYGPCRTV